jgi:lipoprotein signal peptidase
MAERSYRGLLWGLALGGTALDQATKYGVFKWLYSAHFDSRLMQGKQQVVAGAFELLAQFSDERESAEGTLASLRTLGGNLLPKVNHGALFGLGSQYPNLSNTLFAVVSVVAAVAIIYWSLRRSTARDWSLCTALGLILAGTLGNLYDRIVFDGVRDFLHFYWIEWPVFNVADCCLVCGAFLLLAQAFWNRPAATESVTSSRTLFSSEAAGATPARLGSTGGPEYAARRGTVRQP